MNLHGGHEPRIMGRFPESPILDDQTLPDRIDSRSFWQQVEHVLESRQLDGNSGGRHAKAVLFERPGSDNPKFDKVLRNYVEFAALCGQGFDGGLGGFALRVQQLQGAQQRTGIEKHAA
jgi:hypothetical protein